MKRMSEVVWQATGAHPVTCPPFNYRTFDVRVFENVDVIWLGLHGYKGDTEYLYGDEITANPFSIRVRALWVDGIEKLSLKGKLVYASTCFFTDSNFPTAFKAAGATVIGGPGENYGALSHPEGADKLGMEVISLVKRTTDVSFEAVLDAAKSVLGDSAPDKDAREFAIL